MEEKIKALEQRIAQLEEVVIILKDSHVETMKGLVRLGEMNNEFVDKCSENFTEIQKGFDYLIDKKKTKFVMKQHPLLTKGRGKPNNS